MISGERWCGQGLAVRYNSTRFPFRFAVRWGFSASVRMGQAKKETNAGPDITARRTRLRWSVVFLGVVLGVAAGVAKHIRGHPESTVGTQHSDLRQAGYSLPEANLGLG